MWNSNKSITLSCICTKLVIILVFLCGLFLPNLIGIYQSMGNFYVDDSGIKAFSMVLYACCIPAFVALFSLDRMLANIKKDEVFIHKNVTYLRIISWCCFGVAILCVIAGFYYLLFLFMAAVAGFIGLILRVVKNVIEQAVCIKAENDFTI